MKSFQKTLIAALALSVTAPVFAGGAADIVIPGATLPEQIIQQATLGDQLFQQTTQVQQQLQMLLMQARNLQGLPSQMWPGVDGQLQMLIQLSRQSHALAYAGGDMVQSVNSLFGNAGSTLLNAAQKFQTWNDNNNQNLASTLQSYGYQSDNFANEQDALAQVEASSQTATGRMQALQAGNAIAGMQVNQMQLLRQDIMDGNSAMLQAINTQNNVQQQNSNIQNDWLHIQPQRGVW